MEAIEFYTIFTTWHESSPKISRMYLTDEIKFEERKRSSKKRKRRTVMDFVDDKYKDVKKKKNIKTYLIVFNASIRYSIIHHHRCITRWIRMVTQWYYTASCLYIHMLQKLYNNIKYHYLYIKESSIAFTHIYMFKFLNAKTQASTKSWV